MYKAVVFLILLFYRCSRFYPCPWIFKSISILRAPPQIFLVAEITRSDLAISPTHSGSLQTCLPNLSRTSCMTYGYFSHLKLSCVAVAQSANPAISESHLIWRVTRKPVQTLGKPEIMIIYSLFLPEVILSHNHFFPLKQQIKGLEDFSTYFRSSLETFGCSEVATLEHSWAARILNFPLRRSNKNTLDIGGKSRLPGD